MALVVYDRVQETTATTGTGTITLGGAVAGYQSFAVVGNGNTTFYCIVNNSAWEVGIGTYTSSGTTLARTTVLSNSDGNTSPITLVGASSVFVTYPAGKSVNLDSSGNVSPLGTIASGTWQGSTVGVSYGGTGVTSSSGANSVVLRDSNANVVFNNFTAGAVAVTSAAGTTTLTAASARTQILVGSTTQTFALPDATTLVLGQSFIFVNNSSGALTVVDNASSTIEVVPSGGVTQLAAVSIATSAGSWGPYSFIPAAVNWGTNSLALASTVISGGTWQGGTIQSGYGGTGLTTFTAANNALYSTSSSALTAGTLPVAAGGTGATSATANYVFAGPTTGAAAAPSFRALVAADIPSTYSQFASGTAILFNQTAAPTGWTKSVTNNNAALRVVSGSVSTGGTVDFTSAFTSQAVAGTVGTTGSTTATNNSYTPAGSVGTSGSTTATNNSYTPTGSVSTSVGSTTLSTTEMPSHNHGWTIARYDYSWDGNGGRDGVSAGTTTSGSDTLNNPTGSNGSSGSHNHSGSSSFSGNAATIGQSAHNHTGGTFSGTPATITQAAHTHTGGTFTGTAINLAVKYVDVIIATKD